MNRPKKFATLKDVAAAAGLSVATVSRHLNHSIRLPSDTVDRIEASIRMLNYRPNPHARSLSLGRSETIGFVIPDIANPFFARLAAAVEEAAAEQGIGVVLCATLNRRERELDYLYRLSRNHIDGLLFVTNHVDDGELAQAVNATPAVVLMDEDVNGSQGYKVFTDNDQGAFLAASHLIEAGHRRIAFVGGHVALMSGRERFGGFRRAFAEAGLHSDPKLEFFGDYTAEHGRSAAEIILSQTPRPTAIFAASDEIAVGLLKVLRRHGVRVGPEISIIAFDDVGPLELFDPPITAIRQSVDLMGRRGVELVLGCVAGTLQTPIVERLPVELILRDSVHPPRLDA
jgi:LacI family transcriptional regulator